MENNNNKKTPQPWRLPSNSRCFAECSEYKIKRAGKQQEGKKKTLQLDDCQVTGDILQSIRNMKMGCDNFVWFVCPGRHDSHPLSLFSTSATSRQEMGVPCRLKKKKKKHSSSIGPKQAFYRENILPANLHDQCVRGDNWTTRRTECTWIVISFVFREAFFFLSWHFPAVVSENPGFVVSRICLGIARLWRCPAVRGHSLNLGVFSETVIARSFDLRMMAMSIEIYTFKVDELDLINIMVIVVSERQYCKMSPLF